MSKFASQVPFSLEEIQSGSGILATVTDNADELQKMLEITGNVASVTGLDFQTTAEQIQRSFSAGIGSADLFREKGVRAMLGFKAGATVSIEETVKAFEDVFGKGGQFGQATDELANTFEGTLSMIGDKFFNFKRTILEAGFFPELKKQFKSLDTFLAENTNGLDKFAEKIGKGLAIAVKNISDGFILLKDNANLVAGAFASIIAFKLAGVFISITSALAGLTVGMKAFNIATKANIIFASVGVFATTFGLLIEKFREFKNELADGTFETKHAGKSVSELKSEISRLSDAIQFRLNRGITNFETILAKSGVPESGKSINVLKDEIAELSEQLIIATENQEKFNMVSQQPLDKVKQLAIENSKAYADMKDSTGEALVKIEEENKRSFNKTIQDHALFHFTMKQAERNNLQERANLFTEMMSKRQRAESKIFEDEKNLEQQKFNLFTEMMSKRHRKEQELIRENEDKKVALKKEAEKTIFDNTKSSLQAVSGLNRTAFEAFKRFQIAEATINAIRASSRAFGQFPFPINIAVSASELAKGLALVAKIKSTSFREKGGPVSQGKPFVVGEKGPELFVPNQSGNIVANNKMGGSPVNVTFNINTVDARGFNELLTNSRATIVNLINGAVNETGKQAIV